MGRGLSDTFLDALENDPVLGIHRIRKAVRDDSSLCLEIRENYINVYYRGGNILKLSEIRGKYFPDFNTKYVVNNARKTKLMKLPKEFLSSADVDAWLDEIPLLKYEMDLWFGTHPKNEREFQQLIVRENNFCGSAKGTDYFICDIEYANGGGRFDLVAAYWPSSGSARKNNENVGLALIELKYMDGALSGASGMEDHIDKAKKYLDSTTHNLALLKEEMITVFKQKTKLGLIDNKKHIAKFSDAKPEFIFILANHDPDSSILGKELKNISTKNQAELPFDIKFAVSNFMGYGLYKQNIYNLQEFQQRFAKQIFA